MFFKTRRWRIKDHAQLEHSSFRYKSVLASTEQLPPNKLSQAPKVPRTLQQKVGAPGMYQGPYWAPFHLKMLTINTPSSFLSNYRRENPKALFIGSQCGFNATVS